MADRVGSFDADVRYVIYDAFLETGQAPATSTIAEGLDVSPSTVEGALRRLAHRQAIVLAPGSRSIWMAHPFSAVPTGYPVRARDRTYWACCAWGALGIPAILGADSITETQCPDCAAEIRVEVKDGAVISNAQVVHVLVPPTRFWENVGFT